MDFAVFPNCVYRMLIQEMRLFGTEMDVITCIARKAAKRVRADTESVSQFPHGKWRGERS